MLIGVGAGPLASPWRRLCVKHIAVDAGWSNQTQCRQKLATAATLFRICVAQATSRGNGPRHSLTCFGVIPLVY